MTLIIGAPTDRFVAGGKSAGVIAPDRNVVKDGDRWRRGLTKVVVAPTKTIGNEADPPRGRRALDNRTGVISARRDLNKIIELGGELWNISLAEEIIAPAGQRTVLPNGAGVEFACRNFAVTICTAVVRRKRRPRDEKKYDDRENGYQIIS